MGKKVLLEALGRGHRILIDPEEIRQWAGARAGIPAMEDTSAGVRGSPVLRILFDQQALNTGESQYVDRPGGLDLVSWDEWIAELRRRNLGLKVMIEVPGMLDDRYEFVDLDKPTGSSS